MTAPPAVKVPFPGRARGVMRDYCVEGKHENTSPKNIYGDPLPCCTDIDWCACLCHVAIDEIFKSGGIDRRPLENPKWVPPKAPFIDWDEIFADAEKRKVKKPPKIDEETGEIVEVVKRNKYDDEVRTAIKGWELMGKPYDLTPKRIFEFANGRIDSPATVHNVFTRWLRIGYVILEDKPKRFIDYSDKGKKLGYDGCVAAANR